MMGGVCTPFLVAWPGTVPAGVIDRSTALSAVDLLARSCAAAGCSPPEGYRADGENVLPALTGRGFRRSKPIFWEWRGNHGGDNWPVFGQREGDLGLVSDEDGSRVELYDLRADRNQRKNLAAERAAVVQRMMRELREWKQSLPVKPAADSVMGSSAAVP